MTNSVDKPKKPPFLMVFHEAYLTPYYTSPVECPARIKVIYSKLQNRFPEVKPTTPELQDILRVHSPTMVARVKAEGSATYQTALMAVGGAIKASKAALEGCPAFALIRPPGHHAGPHDYRGFCFFNNIAVAIAALIARGAIASTLLLDLDLHYGDGTATIFMDSHAVRVVNVRAETRSAYLNSLENELDRSEGIDLLAVSAGFDTYVRDWGGILSTEDYQTIGRMLRISAKRLCQGRCFAVLEGGYYLPDLGANVLAFCKGLAGM
jgi:acetoin utilization deacetylase AcuC-like enzyme